MGQFIRLGIGIAIGYAGAAGITGWHHRTEANRYEFIDAWEPPLWLWAKEQLALTWDYILHIIVACAILPVGITLGLGRAYLIPVLVAQGIVMVSMAIMALVPPTYRVAPEGIACIRPYVFIFSGMHKGGVVLWEFSEAQELSRTKIRVRNGIKELDVVYPLDKRDLVMNLVQRGCPSWKGAAIPNGQQK